MLPGLNGPTDSMPEAPNHPQLHHEQVHSYQQVYDAAGQRLSSQTDLASALKLEPLSLSSPVHSSPNVGMLSPVQLNGTGDGRVPIASLPSPPTMFGDPNAASAMRADQRPPQISTNQVVGVVVFGQIGYSDDKILRGKITIREIKTKTSKNYLFKQVCGREIRL